MSSFLINGARPLLGEITVQGAKNSVLPILAACVAVNGVSIIKNCPDISDVSATVGILRHLGCKVKREQEVLTVDSTVITQNEIPDEMMREMRSSIIFLGGITARTGKAVLSTPGGCEIGSRPIDLHLDALQKMGAEIEDSHGSIVCTASKGLKGCSIALSFPSVGATENIMIAAALSKGETIILNAAREPEISDLADFLNACGAKISGAGESTVKIMGVKNLHGAAHTVIPDRIAALTLMAAAAATKGSIRLNGVIPAHLEPVIGVMKEAGAEIDSYPHRINIKCPVRMNAVKMIRTMPYPGFPTDIQAPVSAMLTLARGTSMIVENIFEGRYKYVGELRRLGASVRTDGRTAVIEGVTRLEGANVIAPDLRSGAALTIAGLAAYGETKVENIEHIDRGYAALEQALSLLNADISRRNENE